MSIEWVPEQTEALDFGLVTEPIAAALDLLPEGMMIEVYREHWRCWEKLVHDGDAWVMVGDVVSYSSRDLIGYRVQPFGVPIEALLSKDACLAARTVPLHTERGTAHATIRAAIAHVIGGCCEYRMDS